MPNHAFGTDVEFDSNKLLNMGEENIAQSAVISPPSFAVNQNNYNPTSLQTASVLRLTATANSNITGITAPDTARWKKLIIFNISASNITLTDADAGSLAANRFNFNGNKILNENEGFVLLYDQTSQRWRAFGLSN